MFLMFINTVTAWITFQIYCKKQSKDSPDRLSIHSELESFLESDLIKQAFLGIAYSCYSQI